MPTGSLVPAWGAVAGPRPLWVHEDPPQNTVPCSLVEQGRLGWADNGGPAGRSGRSSAAKKVKTGRRRVVRPEAG